LVKGAFIGTEAAASVAVYGAKLAVFGANAVYTADAVGRGLLVGLSLMGGAWIAKRIVVGMSAARFGALMDLLLAGAGLTMLARGIGAG
ncbi:MAG TPA: sulfite exporter TauE/SafE family protein, partial [Burkholderiaceae bacterium]|nr:sulfite exporter TauE/SafE family protein [Burkholderiaceae bacterium]